MSFKTNLNSIGEVVAITGISACFIMGVAGAIAIDVVLLLIIIQASKDHPGFLTGFLCGSMMNSRGNVYHDHNMHLTLLGFFLSSMICTVVACVLASVFLGPAGIPIILGLVGGWVAAVAITLLGIGICALAASLPDDGSMLGTALPVAIPVR